MFKVVKVVGNTESVVYAATSKYRAEKAAVRFTYCETNKNAKYDVRPM